MPSEPTVSVDLGKTRCRVSLSGHVPVIGDGLAGLAAPGAPARSAARIAELLERAGVVGTVGAVSSIGVGAAGALAAPAAGAQLAQILASAYAVPVAVASDVVTAHLGAFGGAEGVCLIVGTGAVALGVSADGRFSVQDGRGLATGDRGSGAWLGREVLRAAERADSGDGPRSALTDVITNSHERAIEASQSPDAAAVYAAFAPIVLDAARGGDEVGVGIANEAIAHLVTTAVAAAAEVTVDLVSPVGGVTADDWFHERLADALVAAGLHVRPAAGDALAGARLMAGSTDLPLEGIIHRA